MGQVRLRELPLSTLGEARRRIASRPRRGGRRRWVRRSRREGGTMTVDEAVQLLNRLLDQAPADPAGIWEAFRTWARQPVPCEREEWAVSLGHDGEGGWIEFRRDFEDPRPEYDGRVALRLVSSRPDAPRLARVEEYCDDAQELAESFARVEELPGFRMALSYPYWEFESGGG